MNKKFEKKFIKTAITCFANIALIVSLVGGVSSFKAYGYDAPVSDDWLSAGPTLSAVYTTWKSKTFYYRENVKNRKVKVTLSNSAKDGSKFVVIIMEETGKLSMDNYFDCLGAEVFSTLSACSFQIDSNKTRTVVVHMGDSTWWKDRLGVYLRILSPSNEAPQNNLHYTMEAVV